MEDFLWGDIFYADGAFAGTIGQVNEEIVRNYVRERQGLAARLCPKTRDFRL